MIDHALQDACHADDDDQLYLNRFQKCSHLMKSHCHLGDAEIAGTEDESPLPSFSHSSDYFLSCFQTDQQTDSFVDRYHDAVIYLSAVESVHHGETAVQWLAEI